MQFYPASIGLVVRGVAAFGIGSAALGCSDVQTQNLRHSNNIGIGGEAPASEAEEGLALISAGKWVFSSCQYQLTFSAFPLVKDLPARTAEKGFAVVANTDPENLGRLAATAAGQVATKVGPCAGGANVTANPKTIGDQDHPFGSAFVNFVASTQMMSGTGFNVGGAGLYITNGGLLASGNQGDASMAALVVKAVLVYNGSPASFRPSATANLNGETDPDGYSSAYFANSYRLNNGPLVSLPDMVGAYANEGGRYTTPNVSLNTSASNFDARGSAYASTITLHAGDTIELDQNLVLASH